MQDYRRRKKEAEARAKILFTEGTERIGARENSVELTDDNIAKICELRDALEEFNPGKTAVFADVNFPLAASDVIKKEAVKFGIPTTCSGICFVVESASDLDLSIAQFWKFAKVAKEIKETVLRVERKKRRKGGSN
ncbi:MAG TPA: hypothetical protein VKK79_14915 [Candidatus Lokiarchaeia archaeon]|nr:hypothetical protein [Candidatus Lokiarchaeia archaeon]